LLVEWKRIEQCGVGIQVNIGLWIGHVHVRRSLGGAPRLIGFNGNPRMYLAAVTTLRMRGERGHVPMDLGEVARLMNSFKNTSPHPVPVGIAFLMRFKIVRLSFRMDKFANGNHKKANLMPRCSGLLVERSPTHATACIHRLLTDGKFVD
jgi:hypothetical protein